MSRREKRSSAPAYTLIDISGLPKDVQRDIIDDANAGGGEYGVRVVEEMVNGGARAPIYGVYKGEEAERWAAAKKDLGISAEEIDDKEVQGAASFDDSDPRRQAALREAAAQRAAAEADRIRASENREVEAITGSDGATDGHATNIVDTTLDSEATNEVSDLDDEDEAETKPATRRAKNRAPR
jgi:hypothetical protein